MSLENGDSHVDAGRELPADPVDTPPTAAPAAAVAASEPPDDGHRTAEPVPAEVPAPPDVTSGSQQVAEDAIAPPPYAAARRPRFRDRPRDWWLRALLGQDARDTTARGAGTSRLQHGVPAAQQPIHAAADQAETGAVEDAAETVAAAHGPAGVPALAASAPGRATPTMGMRQVRGLIAVAIALFLLGVVVSRSLSPGQQAATPPGTTPAAPTSPSGPYAPVAAAPLVPLSVLGGAAHLVLPHEAVALPNGHIIVADTGNGRLVILDAGGHVLQVVRRGGAAFQQPFAVAALGSQVVVLDSARGSLDVLNDNGGFVRELMHSGDLVDARGLAVGPHGQIYVANPRSNSILVLSNQGKVERTFAPPLGAAPGAFNQPSDVAVAADGTIYVLDNQNNRIEALSPGGQFLKQWPAPASDTVLSVHVLPLPKGGVLASDPAAALLVYPAGGGQPVRHVIAAPANQSSTATVPQGLSLMPDGRLLVTDARGGRLFVMRLPGG